jgi:hypothetical protein
MIGGGLFPSGCKDSAVIYSEEAKSPDGRWLASVSTEQYGGPGTAHLETTVYLKWVLSSTPPIEILSFSNNSAYPAGATKVKMNWVTPSHLNVVYNRNATLDFQAVKCADVSISVEGPSN